MEMSAAARVGMVAVIALILFGLVVTQIGGIADEQGREFTISFRNVGGLQTKAPVLLAGVKVGAVKKMELEDTKVNVTVLITRPGVTLYRNRRPDDPRDSYYVYTVAGNLLGDKWVDIRTGQIPPDTPALKPNDEVITGEPPVSLDDLAREGQAVMTEFRASVAALNELVADKKFQNDIRDTMGNFNEISKNLKGASSDAKLLVANLNRRVDRLGNSLESVVSHVDGTIASFQADAQAVGSDLRGFSSSLRRVVSKNEGNVETIVLTLRQTAQSLNRTVKALETLANNEDLQGDVVATVNNLKRTSEEVQGIASDIRSITADPEVQGDLRDTIQNAKEATDGANRVMKKVEGITDGVTGGKLANVYLDNEWNTKNGRPATNLNAFLLPDGPYGAKIGVDSLGQQNLINLQAMKNWESFRVRAGVVRSQFGLGADARLLNKKLELSVDAYNTSKVELDVYGKVLFPGDFYLLGGYRNVNSRQGYPILGAGKRF
jgi:phospholipid/cholesterol/gamma-HCH transport system substrate-binding protein